MGKLDLTERNFEIVQLLLNVSMFCLYNSCVLSKCVFWKTLLYLVMGFSLNSSCSFISVRSQLLLTIDARNLSEQYVGLGACVFFLFGFFFF